MKKNYNDRMETLNNAGIDTSKFFNVAISKDTPKGTTFTITIGDDGKPTVSMEQVKQIFNKIENEGYVKSSTLFRRWVMAQTFRMLNHPKGWTEALKQKPYHYQWTMLENELHVMAHLEKEDPELFEERKVFFTKTVIIAMLEDYKSKLALESAKYCNYYFKQRVAEGIGIADITITAINNTKTYKDYHYIIQSFNTELKKGHGINLRLQSDTAFCKEWVDAFKGVGAYYTLQNLFRFHLPQYKTKLPNSQFFYTREEAEIYKTKDEALR